MTHSFCKYGIQFDHAISIMHAYGIKVVNINITYRMQISIKKHFVLSFAYYKCTETFLKQSFLSFVLYFKGFKELCFHYLVIEMVF